MPTDRLSATFSALADPTRRAILARLALGETSVSELAKPFKMSGPAVSKHLKVLEHAGLIARGRAAQWRPCRLEPAALKGVDDWLESYRRLWEERLDRLDDYLKTLQAKEKKNGAQKIASTSIQIRARSSAAGVLDAPRELVFSAFTDPKHLAQWWGPNGFTTTTHAFEFRPGGVWRFVMHGPDGRDYQNRITYEEIVRPERIVYRHGGGDDVEPVQFTQTVDVRGSRHATARG